MLLILLEAKFAKPMNTKVIEFSLILLPIKFHDFWLCNLGVMFFKSGGCCFNDVLNSSRLIQFF